MQRVRFLYNHIDTDQEQWLATGMDLTSGNFSGRVQKGMAMANLTISQVEERIHALQIGGKLSVTLDSKALGVPAFVQFAQRFVGAFRVDAISGDWLEVASRKAHAKPHRLKVKRLS